MCGDISTAAACCTAYSLSRWSSISIRCASRGYIARQIMRADQCVTLAGAELTLRSGEKIAVSERSLRDVKEHLA